MQQNQQNVEKSKQLINTEIDSLLRKLVGHQIILRRLEIETIREKKDNEETIRMISAAMAELINFKDMLNENNSKDCFCELDLKECTKQCIF